MPRPPPRSQRAIGFRARQQVNDILPLSRRDPIAFEGARRAWTKARADAGVTLDDLDLVETHDCFTIAELIEYEAMGLAEPGEGYKVVREGIAEKDGRLPVNPSGGLKAKGHPIGATGVSMHVMAALQLMDEAGDMQIPDAQLAGVFNMGGAAVANYVSILERAQVSAAPGRPGWRRAGLAPGHEPVAFPDPHGRAPPAGIRLRSGASGPGPGPRSTRASRAWRRRSAAGGSAKGDRILVHSKNCNADVRIDVRRLPHRRRLGADQFPPDCRTRSPISPRQSGATAFLCHADFPDHAAAVAEACPDIALSSVAIGEAGVRRRRYRRLIEAHRGASAPDAAVEHDDPCWFFFTSGTTGRPKAAVLTHGQMAFVVTNHLCDLMPGTTEATPRSSWRRSRTGPASTSSTPGRARGADDPAADRPLRHRRGLRG